MRLGSQILNFVFGAKPDPYISWGLRSGRKGKIVPQDPLNPDSITLLRSKNQREGLTYTYTVWLNIDNLTDTQKKKHIFHKGSSFDLKNNDGDCLIQILVVSVSKRMIYHGQICLLVYLLKKIKIKLPFIKIHMNIF